MPSIRVEESKYPDISITGRMGSGKTYMSDWLVHELRYTRLSFAAALKEIEQYLQFHSPLRTLFYMLWRYGNVPWQRWGTLFMILSACRNMEIEYPKPRKRLQYLGNAVRDGISDLYWVHLAVGKYNDITERIPTARIVFDDARYPNEIEYLKNIGFTTVKLETFSDVRLRRVKKNYGITDYHDSRLEAASERSCDDPRNKFDYVVINNDDGNAIEVFRDIITNYIIAQEFMDNVLKEK